MVLYAPIVVMITFSFNSSKSRSVWTGFTTDWYAKLLHDENIISALQTTLIVAIVSALVATVIGTLAAIGISAMSKRTRSAVMLATNIPMVNPEIVTGVSLMLLFVSFLEFWQTSALNLSLAL